MKKGILIGLVIVFSIGVAYGVGYLIGSVVDFNKNNTVETSEDSNRKSTDYYNDDFKRTSDEVKVKEEILQNSEIQNRNEDNKNTETAKLLTVVNQERLYRYTSVENAYGLRLELSAWLLNQNPNMTTVTLDMNTFNITENGYTISAYSDEYDGLIKITCENGNYKFE